MKQEKTYLLYYWVMGKGEEIMRGSPALCNYKKEQLKKEPHFKKGRFTVISEEGLKYNSNHIKQ